MFCGWIKRVELDVSRYYYNLSYIYGMIDKDGLKEITNDACDQQGCSVSLYTP